jgi:hypothetical protein
MSISAISATASTPAFTPVRPANAFASIYPSISGPAASPVTANAATDPVTTSTTIAQTYGFAPSLIVPIYQPAFYQPYSQNPDVVTGVSRIEVIPRIGQYPGNLFDAFA